MGYLDIHSHVLPGVDDGAATHGDAVDILALAWRSGTEAMVATPHMFQSGLGSDDPEAVRRIFAEFSGRLEEERTDAARFGDIRVHLGAENFVGSELLEAAREGTPLTLGGSRFLLVEFWTMATADSARRAVHQLQEAGYVPVLAHVERYAFLQQEPDLLDRLVLEGCVAQINASAVLGLHGLGVTRLTDRWLRRGRVAVVASDGHGVTTRSPELDRAAAQLESRYGAETVDLCLRRNPRAILADETPRLPSSDRRGGWWRRKRG